MFWQNAGPQKLFPGWRKSNQNKLGPTCIHWYIGDHHKNFMGPYTVGSVNNTFFPVSEFVGPSNMIYKKRLGP